MFAKKETSAKFNLLLVSLMWASTFIITKSLLNFVDPISLIFWRFLLASCGLGVVLLWQGKNILQNAWSGIITGFLLFVLFISQNVGLQYTSSNNSSFILGLVVIWTPFVSILFRVSKLTIKQVVLALGSLVGLWLITGGLNGLNIGDVLSMAGSLVYAFYLVLVGKWSHQGDSLVATWQQFTTTAVLSLLTVVGFQLPLLPTPSFAAWVPILYLGFFPSLLAFSFVNISEKYLSPVTVIMILSSRIAIAPLFAWSLGGELLSPIQLVGGGIVATMVILANIDSVKLKSTKRKNWSKNLKKSSTEPALPS